MTRSPLSPSGVVQLVIRRPRPGGQADSEFFTTWATLEAGAWQDETLRALLQIRPNPYFGARPFAQEFHVSQSIEGSRTVARANPQYGQGGGEKLFIPRARHAAGLEPIGDLIPLFSGDEEPPEASGFIRSLIDLELFLGNSLVGSDHAGLLQARSRFWLQEPLHNAEIVRALKLPASVRSFWDTDIHGRTTGYASADESQVVIAPLPEASPGSS